MKSPLVLLSLALALVLAAPAVAIAGPGDPGLVNGVLEWPRSVTTEPFLVVRGDDGTLYYVGIVAARRDGPLAVGARVSVLGLEGRTPNEITALGVGAGDTTEAALAHLQGARPAPAATTPAPAVVTPPPTAVPPAPAATAAPVVTPPSAAPAPAAAPSGPAAPAPVVTPTTTSTRAVTPPTAVATPPTAATTLPTAAATPPTAAVTPPTAAVSPPAAAPGVAAVGTTSPRKPDVSVTPAALPAPAVEGRRWTEISGVVESLVGRTLVLRSE